MLVISGEIWFTLTKLDETLMYKQGVAYTVHVHTWPTVNHFFYNFAM